MRQRKLRVHRTEKKRQGPWKTNFGYTILKAIADLCTVSSYRHVSVSGMENIPDAEKYAVLISPNHCNTLMDAMVVLRSRKEKTVFGARADLFNNRTVGAIMTFLRIVPMVRRRDGIRQVLRNYETMDQVNDVLANGVAFCVYPEGTHRPKHSLLPINKGIFRMALSAEEYMDGKKDVVIVPCGLEYGDYFHYRSWLRMRYGKPFNVSQFMRENPDLSEAEAYNALRLELRERMASLITYFPDDESYDESWAEFQRKFRALTGHSYRDAGLPRSRFVRLLLAVVTAPLFAVAAVLSLPMWALAEWLCHSKVKDPAFRNTARYGVRLAGSLVLGLILAVVLFCTLPWWCALCWLFAFLFSYSFFYDWLNLIRR